MRLFRHLLAIMAFFACTYKVFGGIVEERMKAMELFRQGRDPLKSIIAITDQLLS